MSERVDGSQKLIPTGEVWEVYDCELRDKNNDCTVAGDLPSGAQVLHYQTGDVRVCNLGPAGNRERFEGCDTAQVKKVVEVKPLTVEGSRVRF